MITHETSVTTGMFDFRFTVHDDEKWVVTIINSHLKVKVTSDPCNGNWNRGLADAIDKITEKISLDDLSDMFYWIALSSNIDKGYRKYLRKYYHPCLGCPWYPGCTQSFATCYL